MNEQVLAFFSLDNPAGIIIDYSRGGEVQIDIEDGACIDTDQLLLPRPEDQVQWYGLWLWEGKAGTNLSGDLEYLGEWRRLSAEEIVDLVKGIRYLDDVEPQLEQDVQTNNILSGNNLFHLFTKTGVTH